MRALDLATTVLTLAGLSAFILEALKKVLNDLPTKIWSYLLKRFTISVRFADRDVGFQMVKQWLTDHPAGKRATNIKIRYNQTDGNYVVAPSHGTYWMWWRGGPMWVTYGEEGENDKYLGKPEYFTIRTLAFNHRRMLAFVQDVERFGRPTGDLPFIDVYNFHAGQWKYSGYRRKRPLDTVYVSRELKRELMDAIEQFQGKEERCVKRGQPWRLGIALKGPPGSGKTTLAVALMSHYNRPIYLMNLNEFSGDGQLLNAFNAVPRNGAIIIEDLDTFDVTKKRRNVEKTAALEERVTLAAQIAKADTPNAPNTNQEEEKRDVTLSGLLNAIDGVAATEGRILIITTNDDSSLDPAITRKGRIDHEFLVGLMGPDEVADMFRVFFPDAAPEQVERVREYARGRDCTGATWQALFNDLDDDLDGLMEWLDNHA